MPFPRACFAAMLLLIGSEVVHAQADFPYDRDLILAGKPMRGGKRVPILSIEHNGKTQIDLWCKRGEGLSVIAGDTITVTPLAMKDEPCTPERAQADEELLGALTAVTNWSLQGEALTLTGATTLRFRAASN